MTTLSNGNIFALLALCEGNPPVMGVFPSQRPVARSFVFSLMCSWRDDWANSPDDGNLRRHATHCDVILITRANDAPSTDAYVRHQASVCQTLYIDYIKWARRNVDNIARYGFPMIRRSRYDSISIVGISSVVRRHPYVETALWWPVL